MLALFKGASALVQVVTVVTLALSLFGGAALLLHRYNTGIITKDRAAMAASADRRERVIQQNSRDVDDEVLRETSPDTILRKEWERPDAQ